MTLHCYMTLGPLLREVPVAKSTSARASSGCQRLARPRTPLGHRTQSNFRIGPGWSCAREGAAQALDSVAWSHGANLYFPNPNRVVHT